MVIKLKNMMYHVSFKIFLFFITVAAALVLLNSVIYLALHDDFVFMSSYYETNKFENNYMRLSHNAVEKHLFFGVGLQTTGTALNLDANADNTYRLRTIEENLKKAQSFQYVLLNAKTGEIITNLTSKEPLDDLLKHSTTIQWDYSGFYFPEGSALPSYGFKTYMESYGLDQSIVETLKNYPDWQYYTAVTDPFYNEDTFFGADLKAFQSFKQNQVLVLSLMGVALFIGIIGLILFTITSGKKSSQSAYNLHLFDKIPLEIQFIFNGCALIPFLSMTNLYNTPTNLYLLLSLSIGIYLAFSLCQYLSIVRNIKAKMFLKNTLTYKSLKVIRRVLKVLFSRIPLLVLVTGVMGAYAFINSLFFVMMMNSFAGFVLLAIFNAFAVHFAIRSLNDLKIIMEAIHQQALGNSSAPILVQTLSPVYRAFGEDLNALQAGLSKAITESLKGERLKSELITNVTHDLKNPLTSIITYIDLLKKENITTAPASDYIQVLDEKSDRLKILIDQLVEASKASSGNLPVQGESLDLYQLMQQVLGEFEIALSSRKLSIVMMPKESPLLVFADRQHLWRIVENLMSNTVKYALEGTRVYIDFSSDEQHINLYLKNISAHPLNIPASELTERFVRGDASRNTEGSGLGLSIAGSLAKLMRADLTISIDGDLFKAVLTLPRII